MSAVVARHAVARHAKPKKTAVRLRGPVLAAATLAGVVAAFVSVHDGLATPKPADDAAPVTNAGSNLTGSQATSAVASKPMATSVHPDGAVLVSRALREAAQHRRWAAHAAAVRAAQQAAQQKAQAQAQAQQTAPPPQSSAPPVTGGGNAAQSALGICIRNAEEGGSYAWGPGNGGGAYQFQLGTWETYGGAASEYGVAGPAYQDQIFDNAIAAGGASNWTLYDGC
jgi:hypothetical protein